VQLDVRSVLIALASLGGLGLLFGASLGLAAKKFAVPTDPLYDQVLVALPGANCGGCGYPGCAAYAKAVAKGEAGINLCPVGGNDLLVSLSLIMNLAPLPKAERQVATPYCDGAILKPAVGLPMRAYPTAWQLTPCLVGTKPVGLAVWAMAPVSSYVYLAHSAWTITAFRWSTP